MRNIRDKMSTETSGMSWAEEQEYLKKHSSSFDFLLEEMRNKSLRPTAQSAARSARRTLGGRWGQTLYRPVRNTITMIRMKHFYIELNTTFILTILLFSLCASNSSYAKDEVTFNCEAVGFGYQGGNTSGPWQHKLQNFTWRYDASMLNPEPPVITEEYGEGCTPVNVVSPEIELEKGKSVFISANRCGDRPSYFFACLNTCDYSVCNSLGDVDQVLKKKKIRIIIRGTEDTKIINNNKEFSLIYFDCDLFWCLYARTVGWGDGGTPTSDLTKSTAFGLGIGISATDSGWAGYVGVPPSPQSTVLRRQLARPVRSLWAICLGAG